MLIDLEEKYTIERPLGYNKFLKSLLCVPASDSPMAIGKLLEAERTAPSNVADTPSTLKELLAPGSVTAPSGGASSAATASGGNASVAAASSSSSSAAASAAAQKSLVYEAKYVMKVYLKKNFTADEARKERERERDLLQKQQQQHQSQVQSQQQDASASDGSTTAAATSGGGSGGDATSSKLARSSSVLTRNTNTSASVSSSTTPGVLTTSSAVTPLTSSVTSQFSMSTNSSLDASDADEIYIDESELVKKELHKLRTLNLQLEPLVTTTCNVSTPLRVFETPKAVYVTRPYFYKSLKQRQSSRPFLVAAERRFVIYQVCRPAIFDYLFTDAYNTLCLIRTFFFSLVVSW